MGEQIQRFIEWDGKIPAWGLLLCGMSAVLYGWGWVNDIERRLSARETAAAQYREKVDNLVKDQSRLVQLEVEIRYIRAGIERLESRMGPAKP